MMFSHYLFISVAYSECLQLPGTVPGTRNIKVIRILSMPLRNSHLGQGKVLQTNKNNTAVMKPVAAIMVATMYYW